MFHIFLFSVVVIDGNVGSGKTTVIEALEADEGVEYRCIYEPVTSYQNAGGRDLLSEFYNNEPGSALLLQLQAMCCNYENYCTINNSNEEKTIYERGLLSSKFVFAETSFNVGKMSGLELKLLSKMYNYLKMPPIFDNTYYIYLRMSDSKVAMERIKERNRVGEQNFDEAYWGMLNNEFNNFYLNNFNGTNAIYEVNAEDSIEQVLVNVKRILEKIDNDYDL